MSNFKGELTDLINKYSLENDSNTPDYILAMYLMDCLDAYNLASKRRLAHLKEKEKKS